MIGIWFDSDLNVHRCTCCMTCEKNDHKSEWCCAPVIEFKSINEASIFIDALNKKHIIHKIGW